MRATLLLLTAIGLLLGCSSSEPTGDLLRIQEDQFTIGNLSRDRAWATGIGCAGTEGDAVAKAQEVAEFNLRSLTGAARYRVQFRSLRQVPPPQPSQVCWEVEARAVSLRMR